MKYLFTEDGLKILEAFCFTPTLFAFDYDGTLAKIVERPPDAKLSRQTSSLLGRLNELVPVAIISGRGKRDIKQLLPVEPRYIVGNHGLEGLRSSSKSLGSAKEQVLQWKKEAEKLAASHQGVEVEDKEYSLALHYRRSRNKRVAKVSILELATELSPPPRLVMGKCVVNLVPRGGPHKGMALLELMLECGTKTAFYIGDDDTDEDVFSLSDTRILSVRVGNKAASAAQFFVRNQKEVDRLLRRIIGFLKG